MKLVLAAAATAVILASVPASAASIMSAGRTVAQDCLVAAQSGTASAKGVAACTTALATADLSADARTGTLLNRATLLAAAGDNQAALADYNAAIARNANVGGAYLGRGTVLLRQGQYVQAKADLSRALTLGATDTHIAYFNRAQAEEASGDKVAAYHDYQRARDAAPEFQAANVELARFHVGGRRVADNH